MWSNGSFETKNFKHPGLLPKQSTGSKSESLCYSANDQGLQGYTALVPGCGSINYFID